MIKLTRFNGEEFYINSDLIEFIESTPDTIITLTTGKKILVLEKVGGIIDSIIAFKSKLLSRNFPKVKSKIAMEN